MAGTIRRSRLSLVTAALVVWGCGNSNTEGGGSGGAGPPVGRGGTSATGGTSGVAGTRATGGSTGFGGTAAVTGSGGSNSSASGGGSGNPGVTGSGGNLGAAGSGMSGGSTGEGGATGLGGTGEGGATGLGGMAGNGVGAGNALPWLKVSGNQIQIEATGQPVILRGVSIEGLGQQSKDPTYGINGVIDLITNKADTTGGSPGWYPVMLRMPVDSTNAMAEINSLLKPAVDYATKKGLYVIVDLHYVDNPYNNVAAVNSFWTAVAPLFKDYSNVFYEPFNESNVQDSWATYKPTMQAWVNLIRTYAPKNLIFAGSPSWDQTMGDAATNPLAGGNIAYVVHMYYHHYIAAWNRQQVEQCATANPMVMTEWGYDNSPGETETDPDISVTYGTPMLKWLEAMGGSWTNWCASNSWGPKEFDDNWNLQVGPREEGGFVKDWLYTNRNVKSPVTF
jgi:endoglucanase